MGATEREVDVLEARRGTVKSSSASKSGPRVSRSSTSRTWSRRSRALHRRPSTTAERGEQLDRRVVARRLAAPHQLDPHRVIDGRLQPARGVAGDDPCRGRATATRSRTVSASSTLWVTSTTVVPRSSRRRRDRRPHRRRATGSRPVVGSSRMRTWRSAASALATHAKPALATGEPHQRPVGESAEPELVDQPAVAAAGVTPATARAAALSSRPRGGPAARPAPARPARGRRPGAARPAVGNEVVAEQRDRAGIGRTSPTSWRTSVVLPAPFGPSSAEDLTRRHVEVDAAVGGAGRAAIALRQPAHPIRRVPLHVSSVA